MMETNQVKEIVNGQFNAESVKETVIKIAQTPCPQTEYYEREPRILTAIREFYRPTLEDAGCSTWIDDYGNLIATQGEDSRGKHVMILGYAMAWLEGTIPDPWSGELMDGSRFGVQGEVVWGRGGSEYHPTNAAILECARIINDSGVKIPGKITYVVSSGGHTSSMDPVFHLVHNDEIHPDMCIIPGSKMITLGNTGRLDLRVHVRGKSVHSAGKIAEGVNAIEGGLKVLGRLEKIMPFPPNGKEDPDMGKGRLSVIGLASYPFSAGFHMGVGSGGHTLQNLMRIMLDRRLVPGEDVEDAIQEIKNAVGDMSPWKVSYERGALQLPTKHGRDAKVVQTVAESYRNMLEEEPEFGYVGFTIDAGYLNKVGIPTIMFGAIDDRFAHGDVEFCQLNPTYDLSQVFAHWAIKNSQ